MAQRFYLDASIWRNYYENRSDRFRPLGEWALNLLNNALENEDFILYSDMVIKELQIKYGSEEINKILGVVSKRGLLIKAGISESQSKEAAALCRQRKVAFGDALHAILARDNNAIMITRDRHFLELADIAEVKRPEELI